MDELNACRLEIDALTAQLVRLFEQRMQVVERVAAYKQTHELPVLQPGREQDVIRQSLAALTDQRLAPQAEQLIRMVMKLSRQSQHQLLTEPVSGAPAHSDSVSGIPEGRIGFQGTEGSFSEQALLALFEESRERVAFAEFSDLFKALHAGTIACGVLPIENSSTGAIAQVYDLLGQYGFYIVGEHRLKVSQNLAAMPGASLQTIHTVYSHAQGFAQSAAFLASHPDWETVHFHNTAVSARMVAQEADPAKAAICSARAAALYGLQILAPDIQDNPHNTTRFIVVATAPRTAAANKISVAFSLADQSGSLYCVLRHFSELRLNLVKLESRPIPDRPWSYRFYLDFEGNPAAFETKALLESLALETEHFQFLGGYPATP